MSEPVQESTEMEEGTDLEEEGTESEEEDTELENQTMVPKPEPRGIAKCLGSNHQFTVGKDTWQLFGHPLNGTESVEEDFRKAVFNCRLINKRSGLPSHAVVKIWMEYVTVVLSHMLLSIWVQYYWEKRCTNNCCRTSRHHPEYCNYRAWDEGDSPWENEEECLTEMEQELESAREEGEIPITLPYRPFPCSLGLAHRKQRHTEPFPSPEAIWPIWLWKNCQVDALK
jgi:hypothetical protein